MGQGCTSKKQPKTRSCPSYEPSDKKSRSFELGAGIRVDCSRPQGELGKRRPSVEEPPGRKHPSMCQFLCVVERHSAGSQICFKVQRLRGTRQSTEEYTDYVEECHGAWGWERAMTSYWH